MRRVMIVIQTFNLHSDCNLFIQECCDNLNQTTFMFPRCLHNFCYIFITFLHELSRKHPKKYCDLEATKCTVQLYCEVPNNAVSYDGD